MPLRFESILGRIRLHFFSVPISDFEINLPDPPLQGAHCIAMLKPWINVGNVGQIVQRRLGRMYAAERVGQLERPGKFYDFTRYRPEIRLQNHCCQTLAYFHYEPVFVEYKQPLQPIGGQP